MEKPTKSFIVRCFLSGIMILGVPIYFTCCLGELPFEPGEIGVNITGEISTTDITSAVLMITNRSKTVDVTSFTITQPEWHPPVGNPNAQAPSITVDNKPRRLEKKAQYVAPSDKSYQVVFNYDFDAFNGKPAGSGTQTLSIPLPLPRQIVEIFIYRNSNGDVIIGKEIENSDPNDLGEPHPEDSLGEGSSPAVIPPEYRNRMATFVTVNMTKSQIIGSVSFHKGTSNYTTGNIGIRDKQSIALGQGGWETTVTYTRNNLIKTLGPVNSIIVPSNDPQSVKEHYLYFYLNNRGDYDISQTWPPFPNDVDEEDMLPIDNGNGRGLIKIINNNQAIVEMVTINNIRDTSRYPLSFDYGVFSPPVPIQYNRTGYVDVVGTSEFPIDAHGDYLIQVLLEGSNNTTNIVERKAYIKDQVVTIVIGPNEAQPGSGRGAKVIIKNETSVNPVEITGLTIQNKDNTLQSSYYGSSTWTPNGDINKGNNATQLVMSSTAMPITPGVEFEAIIILEAKGIFKPIKKSFTPSSELYSDDPPAQNVRYITIEDDDVPNDLRPGTPNPPPTKPDVTTPKEGDTITIDGIEWIKVRTDGDYVLLMLKGVIGSAVKYNNNGRVVEYTAKPSIKNYVDEWYRKLNSPNLKSMACKPEMLPNNVKTKPIQGLVGAAAYDLVAFIPRFADISNLKMSQIANRYRFWNSDIYINRWVYPYGYVDSVGIVESNGNGGNATFANIYIPIYARPCIWVYSK